jgi:hypothetical protein
MVVVFVFDPEEEEDDDVEEGEEDESKRTLWRFGSLILVVTILSNSDLRSRMRDCNATRLSTRILKPGMLGRTTGMSLETPLDTSASFPRVFLAAASKESAVKAAISARINWERAI